MHAMTALTCKNEQHTLRPLIWIYLGMRYGIPRTRRSLPRRIAFRMLSWSGTVSFKVAGAPPLYAKAQVRTQGHTHPSAAHIYNR